MRRWCATAFVTSIVVLLPRPPYGKRTTASARATVVTAGRPREPLIAASIARGMKTCRRRKPLDAGMVGRQGVFPIDDGPDRTALENLKTAGAQQAHNSSTGPMASVREWQFKRKFRTNAYGWRASKFFAHRPSQGSCRRDQVRGEIRSGRGGSRGRVVDGSASGRERSRELDTSSGALGAAVLRAVNRS